MAEPRLHIDPPMRDWRVTPRNGRTTPVIATGHQPYLWHPGILAKDLAADAFAKHVGGSALHVVVGHNPVEALQLTLPARRDDELIGRRLLLDPGPDAATTPPNRMAPLEPAGVANKLDEAADASDLPAFVSDGLHRIARAYAQLGEHDHLAAQTTALLAHLKRPYLQSDLKALPTSGLVTQGFIDRLLADPVDCARCYNREALAYPEAGIRPLYAGRDVVEAPLWAQGDGACTPVFVDLGDSAKPLLFTQGQSLDLTGPGAIHYLRPRAITLSVLLRSEHCDLFIHGTGGGVYDRVTERWWGDWVGEPLAPMAVVSADVYMDFDVPVATQDELSRAVWFDHALPFNVDRFTETQDTAEAGLIREKRELLDHMDDDRDKRRRSKSFKRIHAINAELRGRHREKLAEAHEQKNAARTGVVNAEIAARRDWCFALYPEQQLRDLRRLIEQQ